MISLLLSVEFPSMIRYSNSQKVCFVTDSIVAASPAELLRLIVMTDIFKVTGNQVRTLDVIYLVPFYELELVNYCKVDILYPAI